MSYVDWNGEPLPQEHQSPEKFEMDAEFYPKRVAELEQQLAECQEELDRELQRRFDGNREASKEYAEVSRELTECQAENNKLRGALRQSCEDHRSESMYECGMYCAESESTIKAAKREALLESMAVAKETAQTLGFHQLTASIYEVVLQKMAKELET